MAATACFGSEPEPPPDPGQKALERGVSWLASQQTAEGHFPSQVYGLLKTGESLTPFVTLALLDAAAAPETVDRALAWMRAGRTDGALGFGGVGVDYPVYATGMWLSALGRSRPTGWEDDAAASVAWLRGQQYTAEAGWGDHPAAGGFGMGVRNMPAPPNAGHVDLSMTRRAIEGLRAVGVDASDPTLVAARGFVDRCRAPGGGFVYSPADGMLNKGHVDGEKRLGYGSATTDGILALQALGVPASELADDVAWLREIHRLDENPGVRGGPMEPFATAMRGYYRAGSAAVFRASGGPEGWAEAMVAAILAEQHDDGSWANEANLQKEDDPLVATAFAVSALANALAART